MAVEGFQMTAQGLRKLGCGTGDSGGSKTPGAALGVASLLATHNPVGLIVGSAVKVEGEESGRSTVRGQGQADGQGNCRYTQEAISGTGLDQLSGRMESAAFAVVR